MRSSTIKKLVNGKKAKDTDILDESGNVIHKGRAIEIDDVLIDIPCFVEDIKSNNYKLIDMQSDANSGKVNVLFYPYTPGVTQIKADFWSYSDYGKMKAVCYVERIASGSTCYWDVATSMTAAANPGCYVANFKTKTYVNYSYEDVTDWTYQPSNTGSFSISLSGGGPTIGYTSSTSDMNITNYVLTKAVEWRSVVNNSSAGAAYKIEPAIRASNTSGNFWFRRYYLSDFVYFLSHYTTPYYYSTFDMGMK